MIEPCSLVVDATLAAPNWRSKSWSGLLLASVNPTAPMAGPPIAQCCVRNGSQNGDDKAGRFQEAGEVAALSNRLCVSQDLWCVSTACWSCLLQPFQPVFPFLPALSSIPLLVRHCVLLPSSSSFAIFLPPVAVSRPHGGLVSRCCKRLQPYHISYPGALSCATLDYWIIHEDR